MEPPYWTLNSGHHVNPYNNNNNNNNNSSHVTSLTNHSSPYDRLHVLSSNVSQPFPTNYVIDDVFPNTWNDSSTTPNLPPSRQLTDALQPPKCLPSSRQLPVSADDVISARQRAEYYGCNGGVYAPANDITWSQGPRQLCQYGKNSLSGSSFGAYQMTCNSTSLTVYPTSTCSWLCRQQEPSYKTSAEYRMSCRHVVSDVTSAQCGWTGGWDFDDMMWQGKFIPPLDGL